MAGLEDMGGGGYNLSNQTTATSGANLFGGSNSFGGRGSINIATGGSKATQSPGIPWGTIAIAAAAAIVGIAALRMSKRK